MLVRSRPKARQIRETAVWFRPTCSASDRVDQCVAFFGADSRVVVITNSMSASEIVRGRPGRGSSSSPSRRSAANRFRHFRTVPIETDSRCTSSVFVAIG